MTKRKIASAKPSPQTLLKTYVKELTLLKRYLEQERKALKESKTKIPELSLKNKETTKRRQELEKNYRRVVRDFDKISEMEGEAYWQWKDECFSLISSRRRIKEWRERQNELGELIRNLEKEKK